MSQNEPAGVSEGYRGDEIVADSADAPRLREELEDLGVGVRNAGSIEEFDVELLALESVGSVRTHPEAEAVVTVLQAERPTSPSDLEVLMGVLRRRFAARFARMPRMGKNRDMAVLEGLPHTGGGEGEPSRAARFDLEPRTSVRGRGIRIGILDTAMFPHPALDGRYLSDDLVVPEQLLGPWAGHAVFVAGRILRRAPGAQLDVRRVLRETDGTASAWDVAVHMASFAGSGVEILNMSLGGFTADGQRPFLIERATQRLGAEMVVVAAAGNHGNDTGLTVAGGNRAPLWPAALEGVVAVGAAAVRLSERDFSFVPAPFTPSDVDWIDLWAPGVDVDSTYVHGVVSTREPLSFDGYATWSGTSFASGDVTGEIASIAQQERITVREALARIAQRPAKGSEFDVRPTGR